MKALIAAGWNGDKIAGFIAAQRRDGILQIVVPAHILEIEREIWDKATAATVHVQTRIDQMTAKVQHAQTTAEWETLHHSALIWMYEKATGMTLVWSADFEELSAAWHKKKAFLSKKIATRDQ